MKSPFKILYSNDATNLISCVSPFHKKGEPFRPEMLEASVDETANTGIDVHLFQPGLTVVPWWKSKLYPYAEHIKWFEATYGVNTRDNPYAAYMLNGGDMVEVFVKRCRHKGIAPFISLRMNDGHGKEFVNGPLRNPDGSVKTEIGEIPGFALHCISRFYKEHPEYRLGPDTSLMNWNSRVLNWAIPEVRERIFGFITEICSQYDIEGLELDFMRSTNYFLQQETTSDERTGIMTDFVSRVRRLLDSTTRENRHRWLCVRVPAYLEGMDGLGLDLPVLIEAGVEMVNVSSSYFTVQGTGFPRIRRACHGASVYDETTHTIMTSYTVDDADTNVRKGYDEFLFRRTTPEQFYTTAYLSYARGGDGMSAFNFAYYREHGGPGRGPFSEPPFHVFKGMKDRDWLSKQPQHYFLAQYKVDPAREGMPLPREILPGNTNSFVFDMAPPQKGWKGVGKVRIEAKSDMGDSVWHATLNGADLEETPDRSEPYPDPFPALLGRPDEYRAWKVPAAILRDGANVLRVTLGSGTKSYALRYVDLAIS